MKFTPRHTAIRDKITRSGDITDGVIVTVTTRYAHQGKKFRAEQYLINFISNHGLWVCSGVHIYGSLFKQDGTLGKLAAEQDFSNLTSPDTPQWVRDLVEYVMPKEPVPAVVEEPITLVA